MFHSLSKPTQTEWPSWSGRRSYQGGVHVMGDSGHVKGPQTSHWMSKTKQTEWTSWSGRCYYQGGGPCDARSRTCVGTTDVSRPVKKQHRQNELAGQVDIPTRVEVPVMSHCLSKTTQTAWTSWSGRHSHQGGDPCDGGCQTDVGTTDISRSVKNNTDRMKQLVR